MSAGLTPDDLLVLIKETDARIDRLVDELQQHERLERHQQARERVSLARQDAITRARERVEAKRREELLAREENRLAQQEAARRQREEERARQAEEEGKRYQERLKQEEEARRQREEERARQRAEWEEKHRQDAEALRLWAEQREQEARQRWQEYLEREQRLEKKMDKWTDSWGHFVESTVAPATETIFAARGIPVHNVFRRMAGKRHGLSMEIDLFVANDDDAVAIECKIQVKQDDVDDHLERLAGFRTVFPHLHYQRVYGAVAGVTVPEQVAKYAYRRGLFVLGLSGETMAILNDPGFEPKTW